MKTRKKVVESVRSGREKEADGMKLGAQMFTVREQCKTPEEIEIALEKIAQIGYRAVQVSGAGPH